MKENLTILLQDSNPKNYHLGLLLLVGNPHWLDKDIKQIIRQQLLILSDSFLIHSSSPYNGQKILEVARLGLAPLILEDLRQIDLSYCTNFEGLEQLPQLTEVRFYKNQLQELPPALFKLSNLEHLYIRLNPQLNFEKVCEALCQFPNLKGLYLENNALSAVPTNLLRLQQLQHLYLNNRQLRHRNNIRIIPGFLTNMPCLKSLTFKDNIIESFPPQLLDFARQQLSLFNIGRHQFSSGHLAVQYMRLFKEHGLRLEAF